MKDSGQAFLGSWSHHYVHVFVLHFFVLLADVESHLLRQEVSHEGYPLYYLDGFVRTIYSVLLCYVLFGIHLTNIFPYLFTVSFGSLSYSQKHFRHVVQLGTSFLKRK